MTTPESSNPELPTDRLAQLIGKKLAVLERIREISRRQLEVVDVSEPSELMTVLAGRDRLLKVLHAIEREIDPFRGEDPDQRVWRSPEARRACRQAADRSDALLDEIMLFDKQVESELRRRRDHTAEQLNAAQSATQARKAFAPSMPRKPGGLDLSSGT